MKNKLIDVNDYLFEQLEKLNDDSLSAEELETTIKKSQAITAVAETIIKNGELQFKAMQTAAEYGIINGDQIKLLLGQNNEKK